MRMNIFKLKKKDKKKMGVNNFKVKKKDEENILIEEYKYKNKLLLFLLKNKSVVIIISALMLLMIMLISTGLAFSLFGLSTDFDISYIKGDEIIETIADPTIKDEDILSELVGTSIEGVILLKEKVMTADNDIINYFSDFTAILVKADGSIYKIYPDDKNNYGINKNGVISDNVIWGKITSRANTLSDGTIITYYSDNSAVIEHNGVTLLARDSNDIDSNNASFIEISPSGVAIEDEIKVAGNIKTIKFSDDTYLLIDGNDKFIVNKNTKVVVNKDNVDYEKHNSFAKIKNSKLNDGNSITYFENGAAVIETKEGKYIYVNKSGDISLRNNSIYEIVENDKGKSVYTKICPDGVKVTYYDNGAAVVTTSDNKKYVVDSRNIIYSENGGIDKINETAINTKKRGKIKGGSSATSFQNNKTEVINPDGTSYIVDSDDIEFIDISINDKKDNLEEEEEEEVQQEDGDVSMTAPEISHNYSKSIETTSFSISSRYKTKKRYRIVIEEVSDYSKFGANRLPPKYVKFQALIGGEYISAKPLTSNVWTNSNGKESYVIYDGMIAPKAKLSVNLSLSVDYAPLSNADQNKAFYGTIKIYLDNGK